MQGVYHENLGVRVTGANLALGWGPSRLSAFMFWKRLRRTFLTACRALVEAPKFQPLLTSARQSCVLPEVTANHSEMAACLRSGGGTLFYRTKDALNSFGTSLTYVGCPSFVISPLELVCSHGRCLISLGVLEGHHPGMLG